MKAQLKRDAKLGTQSQGVPFGPYILVSRLAVGGSAEVFLARPARGTHPAPWLAVKRLLPKLIDSGETETLTREAQLHGAIHHPHVVRVLDAGSIDEEPYIALEWVKGTDLGRLLRAARRHQKIIPISLAVGIAGRISLALQAIHSAVDESAAPLGLVHGDVTPSNLYLGLNGDVKLGDFGEAVAANVESHSEPLRGKMGYAAPELMMGNPGGPRSDQFALGVVLGEMLVGGPVFSGNGELARLLAMRDGDFGPLVATKGRVDAALVDAVTRCLSPDPKGRFESCAELAQALRPFHDPGARSPAELKQWVEWTTEKRRSSDSSQGPRTEWRDRSPSTVRPSTPPPHSGPVARRETPPERSGPPAQNRVPPPKDSESTGKLYSTGAPDLAYDLTADDRFGLFARLRRQGESGLLAFERTLDGTRSRLEAYLKGGLLVDVAGDGVDARLGQYLVRRGLLSSEDLAQALGSASVSGIRLHASLVEKGAVSAPEMHRAVRIQARDRVAATFNWTTGRASFYRGAAPDGPGMPVAVDLAAVMMAGAIYLAGGDPLAQLPDLSTKLWVGARAGALADPRERGKAPAAMLKVAEHAGRGLSLGDSLAELTGGTRGPALTMRQAAATVMAARALGWIAV